MKRSLVAVGPVLVALAMLAGACGPPNGAVTPQPGSSPAATPPATQQILQFDNLTVEQAAELIGLPVPVPEYLPLGYAIKSVRIKNGTEPPGPYWDIEMTIAGAAASQPMTLSIAGFSLGMKLPPGVETVMIGASRAWVRRAADGTSLTWTDKRGRQDSLQAGPDIQFDELVKIAESVTSPPTRAVEVKEPGEMVGFGATQPTLLVERGMSQDMVVHLQNNSTKNVDVSFSLDSGISEVPEGITVSISKESFTLAPAQQMEVTVKVSVSADAPSPTFDRPSASSILSTNPMVMPPPASGGLTEQPTYSLSFQVISSYPAADLTIRETEGFFHQLRIDPPPALPPGMVSLEDARTAANFPVSMLLPAYLPEGTNPPPLGYGISEQEPHVITAFYSSFRVELSPEPGVKEPPPGFAGQRDTIRKRAVVIGSDRIDWWADDIHRTVISDSLQMSELRLIAESMMLIGVYSGSWIGMK